MRRLALRHAVDDLKHLPGRDPGILLLHLSLLFLSKNTASFEQFARPRQTRESFRQVNEDRMQYVMRLYFTEMQSGGWKLKRKEWNRDSEPGTWLWTKRFFAVGIALCFVSAILAEQIVQPASATNATVRVKITKVMKIDAIDTTQADWYWLVWVGSAEKITNVPYKTDDNTIYGSTDFGGSSYWYNDFAVSYDATKPYTLVVIELWEADDGADDYADISRRQNQGYESSGCALVLSYHIVNEVWSGDDGYYGDNATGSTQGDQEPDGSTALDQDDAMIWFFVETL